MMDDIIRVRQSNGASPDEVKSLLGFQVIDGSPVTDYLYGESGQAGWDLKTEYPNVAPPFANFAIECRAPKSFRVGDSVKPWPLEYIKQWSIICQAMSREEANASLGSVSAPSNHQNITNPNVKWVLWTQIVLRTPLTATGFDIPGRIIYPVNAEGRIVGVTSDDDEDMFIAIFSPDSYAKHYSEHYSLDGAPGQILVHLAQTSLMTLCFMHCKNVVVNTHTPPRPLQKKHEKRYGVPLVCHRTLEITPMKQVLRHEGGSEQVGLRRALHICRGHFKDYRTHGLFGKLKDIYWWDSMARGSAAEGVVDKDYRVRKD